MKIMHIPKCFSNTKLDLRDFCCINYSFSLLLQGHLGKRTSGATMVDISGYDEPI